MDPEPRELVWVSSENLKCKKHLLSILRGWEGVRFNDMVVSIIRLLLNLRSEFKEESENRQVNGSDGGPSANEDLGSM